MTLELVWEIWFNSPLKPTIIEQRATIAWWSTSVRTTCAFWGAVGRLPPAASVKFELSAGNRPREKVLRLVR